MLAENKYLYWLNKDNIEINDEVVWRELYCRIGCIFHTIQMIEYNIANEDVEPLTDDPHYPPQCHRNRAAREPQLQVAV